jgi:hypothetical protein
VYYHVPLQLHVMHYSHLVVTFAYYSQFVTDQRNVDSTGVSIMCVVVDRLFANFMFLGGFEKILVPIFGVYVL